MQTCPGNTGSHPHSRTRLKAWCLLLGVLLLAGLLLRVQTPFATAEGRTNQVRASRSINYLHDEVAEHPWSIHIVKLDRARGDYEFHTAQAKGTMMGLSTLSDQIKTLSPQLGQPVAAVNADFWKDGRHTEGDPLGLQIRNGEILSAPSARACFWIDPAGQLHSGVVQAQFTATWPGGASTLFGLNEERTNPGAVLYTASMGHSTRARGGREIVLERSGANDWLPLRPGKSYTARVREVRDSGDTPLTGATAVLSLSPQRDEQLPLVKPGSLLTLSTATTPSLLGVRTAVGGGPMLVRDGKPVVFSGSQPRHPRTAIGWNDQHCFLLVVDGRQPKLSVGMSFPELAGYFVQLGCQEAMNLDGGGSSTFWIYGQVMNSPCYGSERAMANSLIIVQKPKSPTGPRPPD